MNFKTFPEMKEIAGMLGMEHRANGFLSEPALSRECCCCFPLWHIDFTV
jgi:hypothetical protein